MVTPDTLIADVLRIYPATRQVFASHGMHCSGCMVVDRETIADGARMYHVDVIRLLRELNTVVLREELGKKDAGR